MNNIMQLYHGSENIVENGKKAVSQKERKNIYRIIFTLIYLMQILLLAIVLMILITVLYRLLSITV